LMYAVMVPRQTDTVGVRGSNPRVPTKTKEEAGLNQPLLFQGLEFFAG